jgi:hypothetical protein
VLVVASRHVARARLAAAVAGPSHRGPLLDLGANVVAPTVVLTFLSGPDRLGPTVALPVALAFPLLHAVVTMATSRKVSPIGVFAVCSVLLTGGIGLLELDVRWFAWKEALFPFVLGCAAVASASTRWALVPTLLAPLIDPDKLSPKLDERGTAAAYDQDLRTGTRRFGAVLVASAVASFVFARWAVTSATGTDAFAAELGWYTGWSFPVVALPTMGGTLWVFRGVLLSIERHTGAELEDLLR